MCYPGYARSNQRERMMPVGFAILMSGTNRVREHAFRRYARRINRCPMLPVWSNF